FALGEARRTLLRFLSPRLERQLHLAPDRRLLVAVEALVGRLAVRGQGDGRKARDLVRELPGLGARGAARHLAGGKPDGDRLVGADRAASEQHIERAALADDAGQ